MIKKHHNNPIPDAADPGERAPDALNQSSPTRSTARAEGRAAGDHRRKPGTPRPADAPRVRSVPPALKLEQETTSWPAVDVTAAQGRVLLILAAWIARDLVEAQAMGVYTGTSQDAAAAGPSERPVASEGPARQAASGEPPRASELGQDDEGTAPDRRGA